MHQIIAYMPLIIGIFSGIGALVAAITIPNPSPIQGIVFKVLLAFAVASILNFLLRYILPCGSNICEAVKYIITIGVFIVIYLGKFMAKFP